VRGLVERKLGLLLQDDDVGVRLFADDQARSREADDSAADDYDAHRVRLLSAPASLMPQGSVTPSSRPG
jgi:hypothetical protein